MRSALVSDSSAAFEAQYAPKKGIAATPAGDETFTTTPQRRARMPGSTACAMRIAPTTFTSNW